MNFHDYHILKILFFYIIGPRTPKKINIYNEVIINELVQLQKQGIPIFNASTHAGQGAHQCWCNVHGWGCSGNCKRTKQSATERKDIM